MADSESHYPKQGRYGSYDGPVNMSPVIETLYQSKSAHELLAVFTHQYDQKPYEIFAISGGSEQPEY